MRAFDTAWSLLKSIDYELLADILLNRENYGEANTFNREDAARILQQAIEDPTNQRQLTTAQTPRLFRSIDPKREHFPFEGVPHPLRFFSPQRITAQQYSNRWNHQSDEPRPIAMFEMPVSLRDDSVLNVANTKRGDSLMTGELQWGKDAEVTPELERIAEANNMTIQEAANVASHWHNAYVSSPAFYGGDERQEAFTDAMRNAGYDYLLLNEIASQEINPPMWMNIARKVDGGFNAPRLQELSRELTNRFGRFHTPMGSQYPYRSVWHIGQMDSAPRFIGFDEEAKNPDILDLLFQGRADDLYTSLSRYNNV